MDDGDDDYYYVGGEENVFCCKHRNGMMILKWRAYCMGWNQSDLKLWETWSVLVVVLDHFSWQPNNEPTIWGSFIPPIKMVILVMVCYCLHLLVDSVGVTQACMYLKKSGMKDSFGIVGFHPSFPYSDATYVTLVVSCGWDTLWSTKSHFFLGKTIYKWAIFHGYVK